MRKNGSIWLALAQNFYHAGAYADGAGTTVCTACPTGQVTGTLGATSAGACVAPVLAAPINATLFNAAGSCAAALTLYNTLYNATLDITQQVSVMSARKACAARVRLAVLSCLLRRTKMADLCTERHAHMWLCSADVQAGPLSRIDARGCAALPEMQCTHSDCAIRQGNGVCNRGTALNTQVS